MLELLTFPYYSVQRVDRAGLMLLSLGSLLIRLVLGWHLETWLVNRSLLSYNTFPK